MTRVTSCCFLLVSIFCAKGSLYGQSQDFTQYELNAFGPTNGFNDPLWATTTNTAQLDDDNVFNPASNAYANILYSPDDAQGKRITGRLRPGNGVSVDDDIVGFVLGYQPGNTFGPPGNFNADYLLLDWKGVDQNFDFADRPDAPIVYHSSTDGGLMPAGLALSRISGLPTADELWQHADLEDGLDGGVTELQRGLSLGRTGYDRSAETGPTREYEFEIIYTEDRVTVFVDDVLEIDVTGSFPDGRFGLYTGWQGPTPLFSDFVFEDATSFVVPEFPTATINRATGALTVTGPNGNPTQFSSYSIESANGGLIPAEWSSIADTGSIDSDAWTILSSTVNELAESETGGVDGATLSAGQSLNLGDVWKKSQFEDLIIKFELVDGFSVPVVPQFVGGTAFERADLNTDGSIDLDDWLLFFPNTLTSFDDVTPVEASLLGDLDGDFDNDLDDFQLFRTDYEAANGLGSFAAIFAVPEPTTCMILVVGMGVVVTQRRRATLLAFLIAVGITSGNRATAQQLDFTTFTIEAFPNINFADAAWDLTTTSATVTAGANTSPSVVYSPTNLQGNRIRGMMQPGTDDDVVGLVFGFRPGDATYADPLPTDADYLLVDWKGTDQNFNFGDRDGDLPDLNNDGSPDLFNELTGAGLMPAGLAVSRVTGLANMDEFWQHEDLEGNPNGGVVELQRANTLGSTPYDRTSEPTPFYEFDVIWTDNLFVMLVDGKVEAVQSGSFSDGRFGVYTCCQSDGPVFSDFEVLPIETLDLTPLVPTGVVDRETGDITITNGTSNAIDFSAYTLSSPGGALRPTWQGLADAETGNESNPGIGWVEAGGSSATQLAELFLQDASGSTFPDNLGAGESFTLQAAYNSSIGAEDLSFVFRTPGGEGVSAVLSFTGDPALLGDFNGDGSVNGLDLTGAGGWQARYGTDLSGRDFLDWQRGFASAAGFSVVPEPVSIVLAATAISAVLATRRRNT